MASDSLSTGNGTVVDVGSGFADLTIGDKGVVGGVVDVVVVGVKMGVPRAMFVAAREKGVECSKGEADQSRVASSMESGSVLDPIVEGIV